MEIEFIPFVGFRLTYEGKTLVMNGASFGEIGAKLSDKQIIAFSEALSFYLSGMRSQEHLPFFKAKLTTAEPPLLSDGTAFKFTDEEGLKYWLRGSIRLRPPATYISIENPDARDIREGMGFLYLQGSQRFATMMSMSGFNSLIICTSADARKSERRARMKKFGNRIIKITDVNRFAGRIAEITGATDYLVRDVTYSDAKSVKGFSSFPDILAEVNGLGDLKDSTLEYIAKNWIDELIRFSAAASIFTKPLSYKNERERRFQFSFPTNVEEQLDVEDALLAKLVKVVL